jgi:repressor LexA
MHGLTPPQQKTLDFILEEASAGRPPPTIREIARHLCYKSHRAAACVLEALKQKGFIESQKGKARSLCIRFRPTTVNLRIPMLGSIPAGFGEVRELGAEGCMAIDVETIGIKPTENTFALRVSGDSMINRHICDGDIVILEHGREARDGQIVAALIDRKSTLKTLVLKGGRPFLKAENPNYPDLIPTEQMAIQGVFRGLIRKATE